MIAENADERAATRVTLAERAKAEKAAMRVHKRRLGKRAAIGADWNGEGENDSEAARWPLAKALLAEGNKELLNAALAYRKTYEQAKSEVQLGGKGVTIGDGISIDQRTYINRNGELASKPNGDIDYKGAREGRTALDEPARRKLPTQAEKAEQGYTNVPREYRGDLPVNNMIDAQCLLAYLQARVGPAILEPFELAIIDGRTLAAVGNAAGVAARSGAMGAGRAIVHMGLIAVRDALGNKPINYQDLIATRT